MKRVLFTNKLSECWCHIINPYLFTKFHASKHLGKRVGQTCMFTLFFCCGAKTVLFTNKLSEHSCHIINPHLLTKFHTSKHLGKRVTQTCMFTLFFVVVRRGYVYQQVIRMLVSYQYSLPVHQVSCIQAFWKRVTQTCMPYCTVWAEVVYCGFPKSKVFTKTLISLFPACHQSLYLHQVSYVGVLRLVRFAYSTRRRRRFRKGIFLNLTPFPKSKITHF